MSGIPKEEGKKINCQNCKSPLICRKKDYSGYESKLQWQNEDGTAHYSTNDGKNFQCVMPKETPEESEYKDPWTQNVNAYGLSEEELSNYKEGLFEFVIENDMILDQIEDILKISNPELKDPKNGARLGMKINNLYRQWLEEHQK